MLLELGLLGCMGLGGLEITRTLVKNKLENKCDDNKKGEYLYEEYPVLYSEYDEDGVQIANNYYIQNNDFYRDAMYLNSMIIGAPGSWKSTVGIYPNLLNKKLRGTIVINDPKGEFYKNTSEIQKNFGRKVKRISFNEVSDKINVLRELNNEDDIFEFSKSIMVNGLSGEEGMSQDSGVWIKLSANLLTSLLCYVKYYSNKTKKNTDNISEALLLLQLVKDEYELENILKQDDLAYKYFLSYKAGGGKTSAKNNILLTINSALAVYLSSSVKEITSETTIDLNDLRTNEYAIYICGDEIGSSKMSPVIAPILQLLFKKSIELGSNSSSKTLDMHFFLDEFGNMGKINNLNQYLTMLREYRVNIYMVLQSFSQLSNIYNKTEIGAIMAGVGHVLFLNNNKESSTVSKIMEMSYLAKKEKIEKECASDGKLIKIKTSYTHEKIISEYEAGSIKRGEGILFVGSQDVMKIKFNRWFEEDRYKAYLNLKTKNTTDDYNLKNKKQLKSYKMQSPILEDYRKRQSEEKKCYENSYQTNSTHVKREQNNSKLKKESLIQKDKQKIKDSYNKFLKENFN